MILDHFRSYRLLVTTFIGQGHFMILYGWQRITYVDKRVRRYGWSRQTIWHTISHFSYNFWWFSACFCLTAACLVFQGWLLLMLTRTLLQGQQRMGQTIRFLGRVTFGVWLTFSWNVNCFHLHGKLSKVFPQQNYYFNSNYATFFSGRESEPMRGRLLVHCSRCLRDNYIFLTWSTVRCENIAMYV